MTKWIYRISVIIPIGMYALANALWTIVAPGGDAEALTFGVPLSPTGNDPATHSGMSTAATEEMKIAIEYLLADELTKAVISVQDYRENDWESLLSANGLQVIVREWLQVIEKELL